MYRVRPAEHLFLLSDTKILERVKAVFPWAVTDGLFIHQSYGAGEWQIQGWKVHLSATIANALDLLDVILPILNRFGVRFKIVASLPNLLDLNNGSYGLTQVGKFVTIYPSSIQEAVGLASELRRATSNLYGPRIATDHRLANSRIVHYRYGAFRQPTGYESSRTMILDSVGRLAPDFRLPYYTQPEIAGDDPFVKAGESHPDDSTTNLYLNRFLVLKALHRSIWGCVLDAIDLGVHPPKRCVIKEYWHCVATDIYGRDSTDHALLEASILDEYSRDCNIPQLYETIVGNETHYLITEKIQGQNLAEKLGLSLRGHPEIDLGSLIRIGQSIAKAIASLNKRNIVHRDIKPSNIMIGQDERVSLIDLAFAYRLGFDVGPPIGLGTLGFCPQNEEEIASPTFATDVFGWGATMHLIATGQEPTVTSGLTRLPAVKQPVRRLRKDLPKSLTDLIDRSVATSPNERPQDIDEVLGKLSRIRMRSMRVPVIAQKTDDPKWFTASTNWDELAIKTAMQLCRTTVPLGQGCTWQSALEGSNESGYLSNLYSGTAGIALFLAQIGKISQIGVFTDTAEKAACWLGNEEWAYGSTVIGLYSGEAGIGYFYIKLAEFTNNSSYVNMAIMRANRMKGLRPSSLDLVDGIAGLILFLLKLFQTTKETRFRDWAVEFGDLVLEKAKQSGRCLYWDVPSIIPGAPEARYLGLLHGAAGIGLSLLSLGYLTGLSRFSDAAHKTGYLLLDTAHKDDSKDKLAYTWPRILDDQGMEFSAHCHGSGGIGQFLIRLWQVFRQPQFLDAAIAASEAISNRDPKHASQCHGLSGDGSFFLDLFQITGRTEFLRLAHNAARRLGIFYDPRESSWKRTAAIGDKSPDYMTGSAGVAAFLLRLSKADKLTDLILPSYENP